MILVGDVHGCWDILEKIVAENPNEKHIVLGDFGIGFSYDDNGEALPDPYFKNVKFIRGNHDNPIACKQRKDYIGDYGVINNMAYISGAWSIDRDYRTPGIDWWDDEELSYDELQKAIDLVVKKKPKIIISHCAPIAFAKELVAGPLYGNRTESALQSLFWQYKPDLWVCGHYHNNFSMQISNTKFICLNTLQTLKI